MKYDGTVRGAIRILEYVGLDTIIYFSKNIVDDLTFRRAVINDGVRYEETYHISKGDYVTLNGRGRVNITWGEEEV